MAKSESQIQSLKGKFSCNQLLESVPLTFFYLIHFPPKRCHPIFQLVETTEQARHFFSQVVLRELRLLLRLGWQSEVCDCQLQPGEREEAGMGPSCSPGGAFDYAELQIEDLGLVSSPTLSPPMLRLLLSPPSDR